MFLFCSEQPVGTKPLDDTPTTPLDEAAERRARHLRVLQRLTDLGMQLAEAAAARSLADLDGRGPDDHDIEPEETTRRRRRRRRADPDLQFIRLSCSVRLTVALEASITAAPQRQSQLTPAPRPAASPAPAAPPPRLTPTRHIHKPLFDGDVECEFPSLFATICEELNADPGLALPTKDPAIWTAVPVSDPDALPPLPNIPWIGPRYAQATGPPDPGQSSEGT